MARRPSARADEIVFTSGATESTNLRPAGPLPGPQAWLLDRHRPDRAQGDPRHRETPRRARRPADDARRRR
ncbi:MAG: hypothetical protein R3F20_03400 [Planctomycetota bacterium]